MSIATTRQQDAVRLLVLLYVAGDRPAPNPPRADAVACIQAESRVHAMDFWLRNPDYLAYELLDLYDNNGDAALLARARELVEEQDRTFPMLRFLFGAYAELDAPLMLLRSYGLAWDVRRAASERRRRDLYLLQAGNDLIEQRITTIADLAWYVKRAELVKLVAGDMHGRALKDHQKRLSSYRDIQWGSEIEPVRARVLERLDEIDSKVGA